MAIDQATITKRLTDARLKGAATTLSFTNLPAEKSASRLKEFKEQSEKAAGVRKDVRTKFATHLVAGLASAPAK